MTAPIPAMVVEAESSAIRPGYQFRYGETRWEVKQVRRVFGLLLIRVGDADRSNLWYGWWITAANYRDVLRGGTFDHLQEQTP